MNILFVLPSLSYRGGERYAYTIAKGLVQKGHTAAILVGRVEKYPLSIKSPLKRIAPSRFVNSLIQNNVVYLFFSFPILFFLLYRNCYGIDVVDSESGFALWASVIIGKLRKVRIIWAANVTLSGSGEEGLFTKLYRVLFNACNNFFIKHVDAVKTVVPKNVSLLQRMTGVKNVRVFVPVVDMDRFRAIHPERIIKKYALVGKKVLFLPATLHPQKNQELAIASLPIILKEFPNTCLFLYGAGNDESRLRKLVKEKELEESVIFETIVKEYAIADFYAASDLVLIPYSKYEGCPITPFEAMVAGKIPIVVSGSAAADILEKEKIGIVIPGDVKNFSHAILQYLRNPDKFEKLKKKGQVWVLKEMNLDSFTQKNLVFFESILNMSL